MWNSVSASQMKNHLDCNSKWYFDKIVFPDAEQTSTVSTELGTEVHACIENYLNGKGELDHELLVDNTYVPAVKASGFPLRVEYEFVDTTSFKVPARGFIDLVVLDHGNKSCFIVDHKTSKEWKYSRTADELRTDPQALLYLWELYLELGDDWTYSFAHHVILTKKPSPERITVVEFTAAEIIKGKATLDGWVAGMFHDARALDHTFVDRNFSACYKYGKCKFWDYCKGETKVPSLSETLKNKAPGRGFQTFIPHDHPEPDALVSPPVSYTLYVDCIPLHEPSVFFEDWVADLVAAYEKEVGEHYLVAKYNEGAKAIALQAHKEVALGNRKLPPALVLRSSHPIASIFENLHTGGKVVKGIR